MADLTDWPFVVESPIRRSRFFASKDFPLASTNLKVVSGESSRPPSALPRKTSRCRPPASIHTKRIVSRCICGHVAAALPCPRPSSSSLESISRAREFSPCRPAAAARRPQALFSSASSPYPALPRDFPSRNCAQHKQDARTNHCEFLHGNSPTRNRITF